MPTYTLEPGRHVHKNGAPFFIIKRDESGLSPSQTDDVSRFIVRLLNDHCENNIPDADQVDRAAILVDLAKAGASYKMLAILAGMSDTALAETVFFVADVQRRTVDEIKANP